jgi:putative inorganic carbon (HCO3(-)) transporter
MQKVTQLSTFQRARGLAAHLAGLEIWLVALAVASSFVSLRLLPVAVGVAAAFWLVRLAAYGRLTVRTPADWGVLLLLLMLPVTLWATALPDQTLPEVYRLLTGIALFYAVANWASTSLRLAWIAGGLILAGLAFAAMAPFSVVWTTSKLPFIPPSLYDHFTLLLSDTVHPNVLGGNIVILLPLAMVVLLFCPPQVSRRVRPWLARLLVGLSALVMLAVLLLTQSRGAWMGFGAVIMLLAVLRWRRGWILLALGATAVGVAVYLIGLKPIIEVLAASNSLGTLDGRLEVWSRAVYMIQDFPFTGIGMGSFGNVADVLYPFFLAAPGTIPHAHNLFLQVAVDLGIPGLVAWLSVFGLVSIASWQVYRRGRSDRNAWAAGLGAALLCSQLALAVHGLTDAVTWGMVRPAPIVWALWGLAVAASRVYLLPPSESHLQAAQVEEEMDLDEVPA